MKGIVLAGGCGTRLHPLTLCVSKQLLPVYNKPMIYYPLSVLFLADITEILIITTPDEQLLFRRLLGEGAHLGVHFSYAVQEHPNGLAEAFLIGKDFIGNDSVCLILGDNLLYGNHLGILLQEARRKTHGASLFAYEVKYPQRYGVIEVSHEGKALSIEEKPQHPKSNYAVTGLYFYDHHVVEIAESLSPSARGELEITDVNKVYIEKGDVTVHIMGRGFTWLDAGTYSSLMQASQYVQVIEERQGLMIAALEEVAYRKGFINREQLTELGKKLGNSPYGEYLITIAEHEHPHIYNEESIYAKN